MESNNPMTPEQLRIITDALAAAGAAIGGPGSVGALLGATAQNTNRERQAEEARVNAENRKEARDSATARAYRDALVRGLGWNPVPTLANEKPSGLVKESDGTYGVLKKDQGGPSINDLVDALGGISTPQGQPGLTSFKRGKDGKITMDWDTGQAVAPEAAPTGESQVQSRPSTADVVSYLKNMDMTGLGAGDVYNLVNQLTSGKNQQLDDIMKKLQIQNLERSIPTDVDLAAKLAEGQRKIAESEMTQMKAYLTPDGAISMVPVEGANEISINMPANLLQQAGKESLVPTADVRNARAAQLNPSLGKKMIEQKEAGRNIINVGTKAEESALGTRRGELGSPKYMTDLESSLSDIKKGGSPEFRSALLDMNDPDPVVRRNAATTYRNTVKDQAVRDITALYPDATIDWKQTPDKHIWIGPIIDGEFKPMVRITKIPEERMLKEQK